jgi:hypothetical protein
MPRWRSQRVTDEGLPEKACTGLTRASDWAHGRLADENDATTKEFGSATRERAFPKVELSSVHRHNCFYAHAEPSVMGVALEPQTIEEGSFVNAWA